MTFLQNRLKYLSVSTCVLADYSSSWGIFIAFKSSFSDLSEVIASDNVISHCPVILWSAVKRRRIKKYFYFTARCWFFSHLLMSKVKKMTCFLFSFFFCCFKLGHSLIIPHQPRRSKNKGCWWWCVNGEKVTVSSQRHLDSEHVLPYLVFIQSFLPWWKC